MVPTHILEVHNPTHHRAHWGHSGGWGSRTWQTPPLDHSKPTGDRTQEPASLLHHLTKPHFPPSADPSSSLLHLLNGTAACHTAATKQILKTQKTKKPHNSPSATRHLQACQQLHVTWNGIPISSHGLQLISFFIFTYFFNRDKRYIT